MYQIEKDLDPYVFGFKMFMTKVGWNLNLLDTTKNVLRAGMKTQNLEVSNSETLKATDYNSLNTKDYWIASVYRLNGTTFRPNLEIKNCSTPLKCHRLTSE